MRRRHFVNAPLTQQTLHLCVSVVMVLTQHTDVKTHENSVRTKMITWVLDTHWSDHSHLRTWSSFWFLLHTCEVWLYLALFSYYHAMVCKFVKFVAYPTVGPMQTCKSTSVYLFRCSHKRRLLHDRICHDGTHTNTRWNQLLLHPFKRKKKENKTHSLKL